MTEEKSNKLSAGMYWEWRCTIEELKSEKLNEKRVHLERELMTKDIENRKLRLTLFKNVVSNSRAEVAKATKEYEDMKRRIEEQVGHSLDNCVIDDITYEVRNYDERNIDE